MKTLIIDTWHSLKNRTGPHFFLAAGLLLLAVLFGRLTLRGQDTPLTPAPSSVPIGTVVAFAGSTNQVPTAQGWALCDGREVRRQQYPELFQVLGVAWGEGESGQSFRLPDLRGRFLRGVNHAPQDGDRDPDAASRESAYPGGNTGNQVGSVQADQTGDHTHSLYGTPQAIGGGATTDSQWVEFQAQKTHADAPEYANDFPVMSSGGSESRPKNANVNWIIKVE